MLLSVSRRTDIPAFYSKWFINRIKAGFVYVRNPINKRQVSKIPLNPDVIDGIVFWSKNPLNLLPYLDEINDYSYYFQFTINPYGKEIEPNVPTKTELIDIFKKLSNKIGSKRVIWRYDPILITNKISIEYHKKYFKYLLNKLKGFTEKCVISFVDMYKKCERNLSGLSINPINEQIVSELSEYIAQQGRENNITIESCGEPYELDKFNINHGKCIDEKLFEEISDIQLDIGKDKNQRFECGCVKSIDIGIYNSCEHGCRYCYANFSKNTVAKNIIQHNPNSALLIGTLQKDDKLTDRKVKSNKILQKELF